jgi:hypothetical protein
MRAASSPPDVKWPLLEKPFLPADVRRLIDEFLQTNGG